MAETYCGKSCADCADRTKLKCPGCKMGPGKPYTGECSITRCCVTRGFRSCEECSTASTCFQWKHRDGVSAERLKQRDADTAAMIACVRENTFLGKWLWVLFWMVIISIVVNFVFELIGIMSDMTLAAELVSAVLSVCYAAVLLRLSSSSYCFRVAGICSIIAVVFSLLGTFLAGSVFGTLFTLAGLIPSLVGRYQEFVGYSEITEDRDERLSGKWKVMWYLSFGSMVLLAICLILTLLGSLLGALLTIVTAVASLIVEIYKIAFLYQTARLFRSEM